MSWYDSPTMPDYGMKECPECEGAGIWQLDEGETCECEMCKGECEIPKTSQDVEDEKYNAAEARWEGKRDEKI